MQVSLLQTLFFFNHEISWSDYYKYTTCMHLHIIYTVVERIKMKGTFALLPFIIYLFHFLKYLIPSLQIICMYYTLYI